ncbi:U-box domain-containing protein 4 isoform X2 [Physcomitrium patens]|nr:U-box domain-containing protein 4-like isoform X2 [Physcomitrium patens]XP_024378051.1 U-box domain-containing protein 4-like isoform X2 [Physcomitrium patens]XP_024378052.1 U-box domain-containing protein 4-like isoform X2 [Physcomitrium patens]XP_024378053.1 U-box domain-containing protein 4-like isoform X2 [Physcomitrium patens]|eukprot:XP_024378050.1 U-box domain-containing protein 4-like isoform X2 [Physcomitrella patens]
MVFLRVSDHIRSQVDLVTRELRRSRYFAEPAEERVGENIETLLREQREGSRPRRETLERVAEKLHLRSKENIAQELQALTKEREEAGAQEDKSEEELIRRLLQLVKQMEGLLEGAATEGLEIPADFRCPLSGELMSDPVILASGQTYERIYIQHWLNEGHSRCPKTHQKLSRRNLIPNYTVKALIANWCETHGVPVPRPVQLNVHLNSLQPPSPGAAGRSDSDSELSSPAALTLRSAKGFTLGSSLRGSGRVRSAASRLNNACGSGELGDRVRSVSLGGDEGEPSQSGRCPSTADSGELAGQNSLGRSPSGLLIDQHPSRSHSRTGSNCSVASRAEDESVAPSSLFPVSPVDPFKVAQERYPDTPDIAAHVDGHTMSSNGSGSFSQGGSGVFIEEPESPARLPERPSFGRRGVDRDSCLPRIISDNTSGGTAQSDVERWVLDLQSPDTETQRQAACELRMLAKHNMENRVTIANAGAIEPLVALLSSVDAKTQENAVTALLNLSINDNNKSEIARAGAIGPLVNVLRVGNAEAMENAAATLFSLSVMDDNNVTIGASGAVPPLVHLLINGSPRGKKDAATALFNLSIHHENKRRIVEAGAIRPLVELMADPAAGMVDKAVAVLANLATFSEGRQAIGEHQGIPALVEVVEAGSQKGKENAAAALLQLCTNSHRHRALVLQEGAIPPLVALSQSGTPRAKEKASALLRHFREQRHGGMGGRSNPDRHMAGYY